MESDWVENRLPPTSTKDSSPPALTSCVFDARPRRGRRELTPTLILVLMAVWTFIAEVSYMLLEDLLPEMPETLCAVLDGSILLLALSPSYFLLYRPFKKSWEETRHNRKEIARLTHHLLNQGETERKRLAQDLHDEFGQVLTGLQFEVEVLKRQAPQADDAENQCDYISQQLSQLGEQVRSTSRALRPSMLDNSGLTPTLKWLVEQVGSHQPRINFELRLPGKPKRLPAAVEIVIYRICQEALNNICKHAAASHVLLEFAIDDKLALLAVQDDGRGFDLTAIQERDTNASGLGLLGMRERVMAVGGRLEFTTGPGQGCRICVRIPLRGEVTT